MAPAANDASLTPTGAVTEDDEGWPEESKIVQNCRDVFAIKGSGRATKPPATKDPKMSLMKPPAGEDIYKRPAAKDASLPPPKGGPLPKCPGTDRHAPDWRPSSWGVRSCPGSRRLKEVKFGDNLKASWSRVCAALIEFSRSGEVCPLLARCRTN